MGNTLKNYSKEGQKLPMFGVGPYLIYGIIFLKAAVLSLTSYVLKVGIQQDAWIWIFRIAVDWLILTVVLKNTEEKWLSNLYGEEYEKYKKSVNRCIPWKRNK